jgi:hypothetical protein
MLRERYFMGSTLDEFKCITLSIIDGLEIFLKFLFGKKKLLSKKKFAIQNFLMVYCKFILY